MATLAQHLVAEFPELAAQAVVEAVRRARDAVNLAALTGPDRVATAEMIARHQLLLLAGAADDLARLDPERHDRPSPVPRSGRG